MRYIEVCVLLVLTITTAHALTICEFEEYNIDGKLVIEDFTVTSPGPTPSHGNLMYMSYTITATEPSVNIDSYGVNIYAEYEPDNGDDIEIDEDLKESSSLSLEVGQSIDFAKEFFLMTPGDWQVTTKWNLGEAFATGDICSFTIEEEIPPINLYIEPDQPILGDTVKLTGDTERTFTWMKLWVNDIRLARCEDDPCQAEFEIKYENTYKFKAEIVVDEGEDNETYNSETRTFTIKGEKVPPRIDLKVFPAQPYAGDEIMIQVEALDASPIAYIKIKQGEEVLKECPSNFCSYNTDLTQDGFSYQLEISDAFGNIRRESETIYFRERGVRQIEPVEDIDLAQEQIPEPAKAVELPIQNNQPVIKTVEEQKEENRLLVTFTLLVFFSVAAIIALVSYWFFRPK